jgi:polyhydroxyalkanoate synthesis regulator phasin
MNIEEILKMAKISRKISRGHFVSTTEFDELEREIKDLEEEEQK